MKIFIDCRFWGPKYTGLGRYCQNLVNYLLEKDDYNSYFLLFLVNNKLPNFFSIAQKNKKIRYVFIKTNLMPYSLREQFELPILLKKIKPDIVHFPHFNTPLISNFPLIITIHDLIKHYSKGINTTTRTPLLYFFKYLGYRLVIKNSILKAKKIIVPSCWVKKELLRHFKIKKDKIAVIYEGVEKKFLENSFSKKKMFSRKVLNKYKIEKPYFLYAGNVYPHKNLERLILAFKMLNKKRFVNLVIVCPRNVFLERLYKIIFQFQAQQFVKLTGYVEDNELVYLYKEAEAFVFPSLMEGFGLPGLEALSIGCPLICSKIEVFKEIYKNNAIYFNPEDVEDIKTKILKTLNFEPFLKKKLIERGKNFSLRYSWEKCARKTLKIYEEVAKNIFKNK